MSPIGRIFIVLNLVLAVAFLGWASSALAAGQDFKAQLKAEKAAHEATKAELGKEIEGLTLRSETAEGDLSRTSGELSNLKAVEEQLRTDLKETQLALAELQANFDHMEATLQGYEETNSSLNQDKDELTQKFVDARDEANQLRKERDDLQLAKNDLERDLKVARDKMAELERVAQGLRNEIQDRDTLIATAEATFGTKLGELMSMPNISGAVLMVSNELAPGLVSINRGKADNVQRGYTFEIYSGGQYKGRVRVVDVQENQCFAVIEKTYEGREITQGDSAATHI